MSVQRKYSFFQKMHTLNTCWYTAFVLITHVTVTLLLVLFAYLITPKLLPFAYTLSVVVSGILSFYLQSRAKHQTNEKIAPLVYSILIIAVSLLFSAFYFDFSWDGEWYHQAAIYHLRDDWNPVLEPIRGFYGHNDASILHFPKGSWYYATSVYAFFRNFEAGKSLNIILLAITALVTYAVSREYKLSRLKAGALTLMLILNPVIWSEITTYLVDGNLILCLVLYTACLISAFKKPTILNITIGAMAIIWLINLKFTGLVFLCFFSLFAFIYYIIWKRAYTPKFLLYHVVSFVLALSVFGFNPYVTNTLERGHPLYPLMGTKKYPSAFATGFDANEVYETPKNMQGEDIATRFFYAHFGRPGNAPYNNEENAELIYPFTSKVDDWSAYHYHETRVAGFGPYFSGILIITLMSLVWVCVTMKSVRWLLAFLLAAIVTTLLISKHFWWPRFGPQLWLLPILPLLFLFSQTPIRTRFLSLGTSLLIIVNGLIVLFVHLRWETRATLQLYKQLAELKQEDKTVQVSMAFFEKSVAEKFSSWNIEYEKISYDTIITSSHTQLKSVVEGYPGAILFRVKEK